MPSLPLLDARIVAQTFAIRRELGRPKTSPQPVMPSGQAYGSVLRDHSGRWRMYWLDEPVYCEYLAVSNDGLNWTTPAHNLVSAAARAAGARPDAFLAPQQKDKQGHWLVSKAGPEGFCVLDAETTPHPAARSRFTAMYLADVAGAPGMCLAYSDDGVNWNAEPANPVIPGWRDTSSVFFYDSRLNRYVWYGRPDAIAAPQSHANRLIARRESEDLIHWTPDRTVMDTDEADADAFSLLDEAALRAGKDTATAAEQAAAWAEVLEGAAAAEKKVLIRGRNRQWYGITAFPYADLYLGLAWMYDLPTGGMWTELVHSYDGIDWRREPIRVPFIVTPQPACCCTMASPPVNVGNEVYVYYSLMDTNHHSVPVPGVQKGIYLAKLVRDRWIGYTAGDRPGELLTQVMPCPKECRLNAATSDDGAIQAEITDADGRALPGFSLMESHPLTGDGLDLTPTWTSGRTIADLPAAPVRLRLGLRRATVYALTV